jgi:hypothetical protein
VATGIFSTKAWGDDLTIPGIAMMNRQIEQMQSMFRREWQDADVQIFDRRSRNRG